jgi:GT2 family glycosyltransferase
MTDKCPRVVIVIVNFREAELTVPCVKSLQGLAYSNFEIVIVENGSGDGSADVFRRELPGIKLLEVGENRGYCGGNNVGIRYALAGGADYVNILNPDTLLANAEYLTRLVDYLESHPDVGAAGPKVFWNQPGVVQNTILGFPGLIRIGASKIRGLLGAIPIHSNDEILDVEAINGVCVLVRRALFEAIGLLDERLFIYCDEAEFGWRAKRAGWKIAYVPVTSVIHLEGTRGTVRRDPIGNAAFLKRRNTLYVTRRMGKVLDAWLYAALSLTLLAIKSLVASVRMERAKAHWKFWWRLCRAYYGVLVKDEMTSPLSPGVNVLNQNVT